MSRDEDTTEPRDASAAEDDHALDQRLSDYLKLGIPAGTLACALAAGYTRGAPAVVLVLAGGALVSVIAIFWASIRTLVGETPLSGADAYALGAPRAEEEQKRAILRALKDLEFERSVGKISEEDYQALVTKYRAEAKRLLRVIDEESQAEREKAEALVMNRLRREGLATGEDAPAKKPEAEKKAEPEAKKLKPEAKKPKKQKADADEAPAAKAHAKCVECGTMNDADAVFCKKCGARQGSVVDDDDEDPSEDREQEEVTS
ncbi:Hypothetical protein A7982_09253 [Minicystis rosea]|nr:Hypothetical protein A7982_09253 [Minicystis rosea]